MFIITYKHYYNILDIYLYKIAFNTVAAPIRLPADFIKSIADDGLLYDLYECNPNVGSGFCCITLFILSTVGFATTFATFL